MLLLPVVKLHRSMKFQIFRNKLDLEILDETFSLIKVQLLLTFMVTRAYVITQEPNRF